DHTDNLASRDRQVDAFENLIVTKTLAQLLHCDRRRVNINQICAHRCFAILRSSHATARVSGMVTARYSSAAMINGVEFASEDSPSRANVVSSLVAKVDPTTNRRDVSFSSSTNSFVIGGMMMR